ncbi:MAG: long-chain fatty acid--CoA ligase, partial [Bacteroidales bacterium]|nr:long-chain fatty acid--CoA ligase [Bacteroidales bacterium]
KPTRTFDLLDRYILNFPSSVAFAAKTDGKWIEYNAQQYNEMAHSFAYGLLELGFNKGDKIVTITNNRPEWNFADMGMAMTGVVHVPVYTSLGSEEYNHILQHSDARMVIISDKKLYNAIHPVCKKVKNVEFVCTFDVIEGAENWMSVVERGRKAGEEIIKRTEDIKSAILPGDCASLIYTSGTTGTSKGVMLSHRNLVENFLAAAEVFKLTPEDRYLSILPLCHVGGRLGNYQTQYSGTAIYYCENMGTIATNLREIKASGFDAVPRILEKIFDNVIAKGRTLKGVKRSLFFWAVKLGLNYQPFGQKSWFYYKKLAIADKLIFSKWREALGGNARLVGCGGASLQPRLERIFWASGLKILNMYGLTETSPIITINRQEKGLCMLGSVGALIDGVEVKIADDGEILCRGHNVMLGYYKDEELTRSVMDEDGWFHTGDVGEMAEDKFLVIKDRKKEIFKLSNGKFIAPQVIENKLKESEFIDQVMVVGEHQKFASALIVPDYERLKAWGAKLELEMGKQNDELICIPEVHELYNTEVKKINRQLTEPERIQRIRLVSEVWSPATGELSASLKLKRKVIESKYSSLLEVIYGKNLVV